MTNHDRNASHPALDAAIPTSMRPMRMTFIQSVPFNTPISFGVRDR